MQDFGKGGGGGGPGKYQNTVLSRKHVQLFFPLFMKFGGPPKGGGAVS